MTAIESQHGRALKVRLAEQRQVLLESMVAGLEYPAYMRLVGQVQGVDDALKLSEQVDFEINGGE